MSADAGNDRVIDEVDRISRACVLCFAVVVVVGNARVRIESYIFEHTAEAQRVPDLRFVFLGEFDALGIASALEVEDAFGAPSVLVVADQVARRVGGESSLARAGKSEEKCT